MSKPLSPRRDTVRRGGFTLLEVVIALAIFVFGALAIVRIFPPALGVIQNSGDQLVATNLNRTTLARFTKTPELVPDGIYDTPVEAAASNWRQLRPGAVAGTTQFNGSLPVDNIQDYDQSALGHFKNIAGERHTIPADGVVLTQFPFEAGSLKIYTEDGLTGVLIKASGKLDFTGASLASDPTNANFTPTVTSATAEDRVYVSYNWGEVGASPAQVRIWSTVDEPLDYTSTLTDPSVAQAGRIGVFTSTTPTTSPTVPTVYVIPGAVMARVRILSTLTPTIDGDVGSIDFGAALAGKKFVLDYTAKDWRWLVQDGSPSIRPATGVGVGTNLRVVNLGVRQLDDLPLSSAAPSSTPIPYVHTFMKGTGIPSTPSPTPTPVTQDSSTINSANLDKKAAQVIFDTNNYTVPVTRVVYHTLDNWAQQLSVAPPNYKLFYGRIPNTDDWEYWRNCTYNGDNILYFPASEVGKTVMVSYSYGVPSLNPSTDTQVKSRIFTIDKKIIGYPFTTANFANPGDLVARLQLTDVNGNSFGSTANSVTSIQNIQGISIQARTAWLHGDRFTQTSSVTFRGENN